MLSRTAVLALLAAAVPSFAQRPPAANPFDVPATKQTMHLSLEPSVSPSTLAPGGTATLVFSVSPKKGMHVYAPGNHQYQVVTVELTPQTWLRAARTKYPPSELWHFKLLDERVEVYSKPFRLTRDVTILATPEARKALAGKTSVTITGTLDYQACDDAVCYRPAKVPVSFEVEIR